MLYRFLLIVNIKRLIKILSISLWSPICLEGWQTWHRINVTFKIRYRESKVEVKKIEIRVLSKCHDCQNQLKMSILAGFSWNEKRLLLPQAQSRRSTIRMVLMSRKLTR